MNTISVLTALLVAIGAFSAWSFVASQRASFQVMSIVGELPPAAGEPLAFAFVAANTGNANTSIVEECIGFDESAELPKSPAYTCSPRTVAGVFGHGQIYPGTRRISKNGGPVVLGEDEKQKIRNGTIPARYYGFIKYRNQYSLVLGPMISGFCFKYLPQGKGAAWGNCNLPEYEYDR